MRPNPGTPNGPAVVPNTNDKEKIKIVHPKFVGKIPEPWDISKIRPEIVVFRKNKEKVVIGHDSDEETAISSLVRAELLSTSRIVFITHGFLTTGEEKWLHVMKDLMIAERDQAVAILGWGNGANIGTFKYEQASANALAVGEWLAKYAIQIRKQREDIYIWGVGHSLGAHLMGTAGRGSHAFDRVTGLDPAGVGFQAENQDRRLSRSDAKLVDVIHTDGKCVPYFGTLVPLGSIDFYPNYGWNQPNYDDSPEKPHMVESEAERKEDIGSYDSHGFTVSHRRVIDYFIWSIDNKAKFATNLVLEEHPCVDKAVHRLRFVAEHREMGYYADESYKEENSGSEETCYYVSTNARVPWL